MIYFELPMMCKSSFFPIDDQTQHSFLCFFDDFTSPHTASSNIVHTNWPFRSDAAVGKSGYGMYLNVYFSAFKQR